MITLSTKKSLTKIFQLNQLQLKKAVTDFLKKHYKNVDETEDYVYAVGDVCIGLKQWVVACGEGAVAATSAFHDLS